jgi:hypothetical protein
MILEIRTYRAVPGRLDDLVSRMRDVLPMLSEVGIDVVGLEPSLDDDDGEHAVLIRSFASRADRDRLEEAFYGSDAWRTGPRDGVMELIESYHTVVLERPDDAVRALDDAFARSHR